MPAGDTRNWFQITTDGRHTAGSPSPGRPMQYAARTMTFKARALAGIVAACVIAGALSWIGCDGNESTVAPDGPRVEGAGCLEQMPSQFPYQPGCCDYEVLIPDEVIESGFDDGTVGAGAPDHVHLSWAGPSHTSITVSWRSHRDGTATQVLYGKSADAVSDASGPSDDVARSTGHHVLYSSFLDGATETRMHEVHICGLEPSTTYHYKVGGPGNWSTVSDFATAPSPGDAESFRFVLIGDSRDDPPMWAQVAEAAAAQGPDFVVFTGDAVGFGVSQVMWNEWFEASSGDFVVQDWLSTTPFMPANGNHDNLALNYVVQFALPQQVTGDEQVQGEEWYSFTYGNAHFLALNDTPEASALGADQLGWMEEQLSSIDRTQVPWVFAYHHRSTYSCGGSHGSDLELRKAWQPLFDKYEVDMVFSGHDHLYERSKPIRGLDGDEGIVAAAGPDDTPVDQSGTLYVVSGGAGAPLYGADDTCEHTHLTESTRNFSIVEIDGRTLRLTTSRLDGSELESIEFAK